MRRPGFEPGQMAWKATIIAIRPPAHNREKINRMFINLRVYFWFLEKTYKETKQNPVYDR